MDTHKDRPALIWWTWTDSNRRLRGASAVFSQLYYRPMFGAPCLIRTDDIFITSEVQYHCANGASLTWSRTPDSNGDPLRPKRSDLPISPMRDNLFQLFNQSNNWSIYFCAIASFTADSRLLVNQLIKFAI